MPRSRPGIFLKGPPSSPAVGSPGRFSIRARRISASPVPIPSESSFWVFPDRGSRGTVRTGGADGILPSMLFREKSLPVPPGGTLGDYDVVCGRYRPGGGAEPAESCLWCRLPAALLSHDRENGLQCDKRAVYRERDLWYARSLLAVNPPIPDPDETITSGKTQEKLGVRKTGNNRKMFGKKVVSVFRPEPLPVLQAAASHPVRTEA